MGQAAVLMELKVNLGLPWEKLAQRLGLTKQRVLDLVGLLDLQDEIKEEIRHKKLTEKHGRVLRQLLDKAEVLREVFNFLKEKKLTGDQSLELVRKIKSELGFTIEEAYRQSFLIKKNASKEHRVKKDPINVLIDEGNKFLKILDNFKLEDIDIKKKQFVKDSLLSMKNRIQNILNKLIR